MCVSLFSISSSSVPTGLKEVDLSDNPAIGRSAEFREAIRDLPDRSDKPLFPVLDRLVLEGCSLGNEGLGALVTSLLPHASSLRHLDVSGNAITCAASPTLLLLMYQVQYLRLFNNAIADAGTLL